MSDQAMTMQAQDLERTKLLLERNVVQAESQQQATNNSAASVGSVGADEGYGEGGNAIGHLSGNHLGDINDNKQYPADYWAQKNQRKQEKHQMEQEEHKRKQEEHKRKQEKHQIKEEIKRQSVLQGQAHVPQEGETQQRHYFTPESDCKK